METIKDFSGKRLLSIGELMKYTGLGRSTCLVWGKKIGALRHIGSRALYDKAVVDKAIDELTE